MDSPRNTRSGDGSFIAAGCELEGNFTFSGPLTVAGEMKGTIRSEGLIMIEERGRLEGNVEAPVIIVHGAIAGDIRATESLEIWSGAKVEGKVVARSIRVDQGSLLTAEMTIIANLPPAAATTAPAPVSMDVPAAPPNPNRPASPLPGSGLARRLNNE